MKEEPGRDPPPPPEDESRLLHEEQKKGPAAPPVAPVQDSDLSRAAVACPAGLLLGAGDQLAPKMHYSAGQRSVKRGRQRGRAPAGGEQQMHEPLDTVEIPLPLSMVVQIDQICDRFEAAWHSVAPGGPGPQIDDYLGDTPEPERGVVLRHLVALDLDYRRRHGETPLPSDCQRRYPGLSDRLLADLLALPASGAPAAPAAEEPAATAPLGAAAANPVLDTSTVDLPPPSAPLLRSNRYVIRQFHARGGTSEIWLAKDAEIGRQVAVKKLDKKHAADQDRFLVEAQVTGQLEHPGIVPVHDLGRDKEGRPFYVMTFIQGRTLKQAIEESPRRRVGH